MFSLTKFTSAEPGPNPAAASNKFPIRFLLSHECTEGTSVSFPPAETCLFYITLKIKLPESTLIRKGKDKEQPSDPKQGHGKHNSPFPSLLLPEPAWAPRTARLLRFPPANVDNPAHGVKPPQLAGLRAQLRCSRHPRLPRDILGVAGKRTT